MASQGAGKRGARRAIAPIGFVFGLAFLLANDAVWVRRQVLEFPPPWDQALYLRLSLQCGRALRQGGLAALYHEAVTGNTHVAPLFPIETTDANLVSRKGAIGPAPAGSNNYYALEYYKQLVPNAEVTLPGSICNTCDPKEIAPANTWTPQNLASLVERLGGAIVVTHSQSGIMGHHMARILKERGHLGLLKGLVTLEGSCSLPNSGLQAADFDNIPYLAVKGDYTATSMVCQDTVNAINARRADKQGTAKAEYVKLDDMGILGVTHMMMLDKKNLEIADVLYNWLGKNVSPARSTRSTH